jgi:hypothetical protein
VIHVGVDAQQQVLHDQEVGVRSDVPRRLPTARYGCLGASRPQVVAGECLDQPLHPLSVGEPPGANSRGDVVGHADVQRREVPGGVVGIQCNVSQLIDRVLDHDAAHLPCSDSLSTGKEP